MTVITIDKYTQASKQKEIFSDFMTTFEINPNSGDLYREINLNAIKQSIRSILLTNRGERLFSDLGSDVRRQLFELLQISTVEILEQIIKDAITIHEPRVKFEGATVVPSEDANLLAVTVQFSTINRPGIIENISVLLTRVR